MRKALNERWSGGDRGRWVKSLRGAPITTRQVNREKTQVLNFSGRRRKRKVYGGKKDKSGFEEMRISSTKARGRLGELITRAIRGEAVVITRHGKATVKLVSLRRSERDLNILRFIAATARAPFKDFD
ncbi:type II toxin-antitoxin system Phd/YefM family antitoxin [Alloacidobacterium sp.]|uniref:type II toxin-antitoxin system Phd/YefM family antitoxin n=1 Tax=Alloacidobacterium sp. TaxID=2951999 RepID=UPI002D648475|nr:type II toxin-antitoxin system Phd/YefM family antitoxin [Alloacidobacterium sp.]HYK36874.1 type II toxin-antitoxin system Phd/YefM family antitoxin [Alloacidobacterium sp.]